MKTLLALLLALVGVAHAAPTVSITSPSDGATFVAPANIPVAITAQDSQSTINRVELYWDDGFGSQYLITTLTTAPYTFNWTSVPYGYYQLIAVAISNNGAQGYSTPVVVVAGLGVTMSAPANGSIHTTPATVALTATVEGEGAPVQQVNFYRGATHIGTGTYSPPNAFSFNWQNAPVGTHSVTASAIASDQFGSTFTSAPINVSVTSAPTVSLTSPANNATFTAPAGFTISATAADSDGTIAKVEFYQGATLIGTDTTAPYSANVSSLVAGTYSFTAVATDNLGAQTTSSSISVSVSSSGPKLHFIHVDHLNTPRLVTNNAQQAVWRWDQQEPFGVSPADENPSGLGAFELPLRFPGQYADKETSLFYNYFRDYDAALGGYKQSDPIGLHGGLNTYSYVAGNPVSLVDPDGLRGVPGLSQLLKPAEAPVTPRPVPLSDPVFPVPLPGPSDPNQKSETCFLYFIMDCNLAVVYVGITNNPKRRESEHRYNGVIKKHQCQTCRLDFVVVAQYSSREACRADERSQIYGRRPIFNILGNPDSRAEIAKKQAEWHETNCCR